MGGQAQREFFWYRGIAMTAASAYEVHSEARGPHWIAWITRGGGAKPERSVVIIGATKAEAEASARQWAESQV